ncbi:unnamed protein product (macronuclear) [Paramecium tetraurelia]|uniref:Phosphoglycerate mutase family protein n=1 Tax=Paramecium tetraurelia TaxID=5888 RepID=A0EHZ9_PARTE|nr:uncharacterized protein GSPATT00027267001 [Paramecium tetraurelia]CAK94940.1 unnamed protein product [Paramecium tetraurelia]|eukprot:XP_001462313.1 hypothetical protein (macronuclear) [Paramecium tetraurelia strain d4-2]
MIIFVRNGERDKKYDGLNKAGADQALKRAKEIKTQIQDYCNENDYELSDINLIICSSPFKKCLETADIIKQNIESKELKFKKKYNKIFTQYELGDYQHPKLCSAEDVSLDFAGAYIKSVTKETLIDPKQLPQNNYKKETSEQVEERIGAAIYQITNKLQNSKDNTKQVYIIITHKVTLEILVDIFEGSREISESGLITIKFKSDSTFGISFVGKVFKMKEKKQINEQFEDFQQNISEDEDQQQEDEEQQEDGEQQENEDSN